MLFARGIWCVADVSSVSPSSEQIKKDRLQLFSIIAAFITML